MQCCAMGKLTGMTSDPRLAISHHCENRVPGRKDWKDTTAMAAVARVIWWAPRAVGLERQSQDLADHSGLGWAGQGPGRGDESTFSATEMSALVPVPIFRRKQPSGLWFCLPAAAL